MSYSIKKILKVIILCILGYLITGYVAVLSLYIFSNPGYLIPPPPRLAQYKRRTLVDFVIELMLRPDFWRDVLIWPLFLIASAST